MDYQRKCAKALLACAILCTHHVCGWRCPGLEGIHDFRGSASLMAIPCVRPPNPPATAWPATIGGPTGPPPALVGRAADPAGLTSRRGLALSTAVAKSPADWCRVLGRDLVERAINDVLRVVFLPPLMTVLTRRDTKVLWYCYLQQRSFNCSTTSGHK